MSDFNFYLKNGLVVADNATVGGSLLMNNMRTSVTSNVTINTSQTVVDSMPINQVRSVRYHMQVVSNNAYQTSWVLLIHDGVNSYLTEYAIVSSIDLPLVNFQTDISDGNVRLLGTAYFGTGQAWFQKTTIETASID